jgi:iron complex transport system substrate-binding protein
MLKSAFRKSYKIFFLLVLVLLSFNSCAKKEAKEGVPQRIVALSPVATEILFAVGAEDQVAAISDLTDYPPEALSKPKAGGFDGKTLSMETILSFKPDLVYLTDGMHNFLIEQLEGYGIKYYLSKADSIKAVEQEILDIGKITGHEKQAEKVVSEIRKKVLEVKSKKADAVQTVYYEVWNSPFMSIGSKSFLNDIFNTVNLKNIFDDIDDGYPVVSEETILARQPDYIFIPMATRLTVEDVKSRKGWDSLPAVKNNKVFIINDNLYTRSGPRITQTLTELSELIK